MCAEAKRDVAQSNLARRSGGVERSGAGWIPV